MTVQTIGDLAQSFFLLQRSNRLKTDQFRLTQELATGQVADVKSVLAGNFSYLSELESDMKTLDAYRIATTEATQFTGAMQQALDRVETSNRDLVHAMLVVGSNTVDAVVSTVATDAEANLAQIVTSLNTSLAGRSLFSGTATNVSPLSSTDDILNGLRAALVGQTSVDDILTTARNWFDDPAGFEATVYRGESTDLPPFRLSRDTSVSLPIKATDPALREVMMHSALAALVTDPTLGLDNAGQRALLLEAGEGLLVGNDGVIALRGNIGFAEARIEDTSARNAAELTSLQFARNAFLEADPYETATKLEDVQFQLQSLYSITVRMSELSLGNYLR